MTCLSDLGLQASSLTVPIHRLSNLTAGALSPPFPLLLGRVSVRTRRPPHSIDPDNHGMAAWCHGQGPATHLPIPQGDTLAPCHPPRQCLLQPDFLNQCWTPLQHVDAPPYCAQWADGFVCHATSPSNNGCSRRDPALYRLGTNSGTTGPGPIVLRDEYINGIVASPNLCEIEPERRGVELGEQSWF